MDDDDVTREEEVRVTCVCVCASPAGSSHFFLFFLMMVQYFISGASAVRQTPVLEREKMRWHPPYIYRRRPISAPR